MFWSQGVLITQRYNGTLPLRKCAVYSGPATGTRVILLLMFKLSHLSSAHHSQPFVLIQMSLLFPAWSVFPSLNPYLFHTVLNTSELRKSSKLLPLSLSLRPAGNKHPLQTAVLLHRDIREAIARSHYCRRAMCFFWWKWWEFSFPTVGFKHTLL